MLTARHVTAATAIFLLALTCAVPAVAATHVVSPDGLGDYPTIQAAVDAAIDGDVIELTDGTFTGDGNRDIVVPSKNIAIQSQSGDPLLCQINCGGSARSEHRGFHFTATGDGAASLTGVAVIGGYTTTAGAGIWIEGADPGQLPTMSCCDVFGNAAGADYGGALPDQTGIDGNIMEDPQLCGIGLADYTLDAASPCLPGGNGCGVQMGAFGQGCDSPVEETSWGTIKAMYR